VEKIGTGYFLLVEKKVKFDPWKAK